MKTRLRSGVAVAVVEAGSYSSDSTPSLGTSISRRCSRKKTKEKNNNPVATRSAKGEFGD